MTPDISWRYNSILVLCGANIMLPEITGVILAGGKASRMHGQDKGLVMLHGKPLVQHVAERLQPQVTTILISANRNIPQYQHYFPVISDSIPDFAGPLAGILRALEQCPTEWLVCVPCDVPTLPLNLVTTLWQGKQQALAAYVHDGERGHPTLALCHRSLITPLAQFLAAGDRKLMLFMQAINAQAVLFPTDSVAFKNLNTPQDLANWHDETAGTQ